MSKTHYRILFEGKISDDRSVNQVKHTFTKMLKKNLAEIDVMFENLPFTIAETTDADRIERVVDKLREHGVIVEVEQFADNAHQDAADHTQGFKQPPIQSLAMVPDMSASAKVRHLGSLIERIPSTEANQEANTPTWKRRMRYRFDSFMARGGTSIFKVLTAAFVATFLVIGIARGIFLHFAPDVALQHDLGFLGNLYITFLEITDPGNMAQDISSSPWYKIFAVLAGLAGIIMLSALIAFITTTLDQKINELKRGRSKVIEEGHTLVLGWNEQRIVEVLRELVLANESEDDGCVVILADKDKEEMDDALRLRLKERMTTRFVTRSGNVSTLSNLDMVSLEAAKSVIILASCEDTDSAERKAASDAKAIQTVLATIGRAGKSGDVSIVVEIFNPTYRDIVSTTFPDNVVTVNTSDILAKLLVQTSRSEGLSVVYSEMLSFDGCEIYFHHDNWQSATFGEIAYRFPDGVPIGVRTAEGILRINPPIQYAMQDSDEIVIVADDDSTIELRDQPVATPDALKLPERRNEQAIERELMIGWNHKAPIIVAEFSDYILPGSQIHVLLKAPTEEQRREIAALDQELSNIEVSLIERDCLNLEQLMSLEPFNYNNIIILAGGDTGDGEASSIDVNQVDSENLVALLLLRRIFSQHPRKSEDTKLITEILDSQNHELVARAGVKDVIISNRLVSMIMAQISENSAIEQVYDDIFQEDGSEIYLKPVSLYFDELPTELKFADIMALVQQRGETCIGIRKKAQESDPGANNGVQLIPEKNERFELSIDDSLVVVAEDEL